MSDPCMCPKAEDFGVLPGRPQILPFKSCFYDKKTGNTIKIVSKKLSNVGGDLQVDYIDDKGVVYSGTPDSVNVPATFEKVDCDKIVYPAGISPSDVVPADVITNTIIVMCDDGTPFLRHFTYTNGEVTAKSDTKSDGTTPYSPSGNESIGECPQLCEPSVSGGIKTAWGV